jgi:nucleotide-binding universal stress UspA family protein
MRNDPKSSRFNVNRLTVEKAETKELTIRRIIAALDLTKKCDATLDCAAKLARWYHASLCVAYVFWPAILSEGDEDYLIDRQQSEFRHKLDQLVNHIRRIVPRSKSAFLVGEPADRITALARDSHADLIITTSYYAGFISPLSHLERAIKIARQAPCPVLVCHEEDLP